MKTYLVVSGTLFGVVAIAHVLRVLQEGPALIAEPMFAFSTLISACLCVWAFVLLRTASHRNRGRYPRM